MPVMFLYILQYSFNGHWGSYSKQLYADGVQVLETDDTEIFK